MLYIHKHTGAVLDSSCVLLGEVWQAVKPPENKKVVQDKEKQTSVKKRG